MLKYCTLQPAEEDEGPFKEIVAELASREAELEPDTEPWERLQLGDAGLFRQGILDDVSQERPRGRAQVEVRAEAQRLATEAELRKLRETAAAAKEQLDCS
jgi:hypothetical protein